MGVSAGACGAPEAGALLRQALRSVPRRVSASPSPCAASTADEWRGSSNKLTWRELAGWAEGALDSGLWRRGDLAVID